VSHHPHPNADHLLMPKGRLEAFSDGVFAIVITLLVLEIKVPTHDQVHEHGMALALVALWPKIFSFIVSFVVVGIYWVGHHHILAQLRGVDRPFMWLNLNLLLSTCSIPFSAALLGEFVHDHLATTAYAVNLVLVGISMWMLWAYAAHHHRLVDPKITEGFKRLVRNRILLAPACYLAAVPASFIHPGLAIACFALVPVIYIVPRSIDRKWAHHATHLAPSEGRTPE
jgi:uncharacterized membrane protein